MFQRQLFSWRNSHFLHELLRHGGSVYQDLGRNFVQEISDAIRGLMYMTSLLLAGAPRSGVESGVLVGLVSSSHIWEALPIVTFPCGARWGIVDVNYS